MRKQTAISFRRLLGQSSLIMILGKATETSMQIGLLAYLARVIGRDDFGLYTVTFAIQLALQPIIENGFVEAYIRTDPATLQRRSAFWYANAAAGFINVLLLLGLSPVAVAIFGDRRLFQALMWTALGVLVASFGRQSVAQLNKDLSFVAIASNGVISMTAAVAFSVTLAMTGLGWQSLVGRQVVYNVVYAVLSISRQPITLFLPARRHFLQIKDQLRFGFQLMLSRFLFSWVNSADRLIVSKISGLSISGVYGNAATLTRLPDTHLRTPVTNVLFPAIQSQANEVRGTTLVRAMHIAATILLSVTGMLVASAKLITVFVLGPNWSDAVLLIRFLGVYTVAKVVQSLLSFSLMTLGNGRQILTNSLYGALPLVISIVVYIVHPSVDFFAATLSVTSLVFWLFTFRRLSFSIFVDRVARRALFRDVVVISGAAVAVATLLTSLPIGTHWAVFELSGMALFVAIATRIVLKNRWLTLSPHR